MRVNYFKAKGRFARFPKQYQSEFKSFSPSRTLVVGIVFYEYDLMEYDENIAVWHLFNKGIVESKQVVMANDDTRNYDSLIKKFFKNNKNKNADEIAEMLDLSRNTIMSFKNHLNKKSQRAKKRLYNKIINLEG